MPEFPFGKHKGKDVEDVPSNYLRWVVMQDWFERDHPDLLKASEEELAFRDTWRKHFYD